MSSFANRTAATRGDHLDSIQTLFLPTLNQRPIVSQIREVAAHPLSVGQDADFHVPRQSGSAPRGVG